MGILNSFQHFLSSHFKESVHVNARSKGEVSEMKELVPCEQQQDANNNEEKKLSKKDSSELHQVYATQTVEEKNQQLFKLLEEAATKGVNILHDENFKKHCTKVMNFGDNQQKAGKEHSETSHPSLIGIDEDGLEGINKDGCAKSAGQDNEISEKKKSLLGPKEKEPADKDQRISMEKAMVSKGQTKSAFAETPAGITVHDVPSSCKVQPTCSFAEIAKKGKSAHVISTPTTIPLLHNPNGSKTSSPTARDDSPIFRISQEVLAKRIEACSFSIVGRLTLAKGDTPWTLKKLHDKLESIWNLKTTWRLISLGRGFYHILLHSKDEWDRVWARGPLSLKPGILRLQKWSIDFDPYREKTTNAQVWFRIYHLPWGLWDPDVIAGIARKVGSPLKFDKATMEGDFGHYARILVDVDLSKNFLSNIHVECGNIMIEVKMVPESMPQFCRGCNSIGHSMTECRSLSKQGVFSKSSNGTRGSEQNIQNAASIGNFSLHAGSSKKDNSDSAPNSGKIDNNVHCMGLTGSSPSLHSQADKGHLVNKETSSLPEIILQKQPGSLPSSSTLEGISVTETASTKGTPMHKDQDKSESIPLHNKFHVLEENALGNITVQNSVHQDKRTEPLTATLLRKQRWGDIFSDKDANSIHGKSELPVNADIATRPHSRSLPPNDQ